MKYSDAIEYLYRLRWFGIKLGLENTIRLASCVGNPHKKLKFIHVAGTNGKGSTCAFLESIYRNAGLKVGLYTSPHLISFCERIQINRELIAEDDVIAYVQRLKEIMESDSWRGDQMQFPTFFEVVTVLALMYFCDRGCDLVIWETGLGGRLDATNIVLPLASVITNIQMDHCQWLGDSFARIAYEKAGIIKSNVPVITGTDVPEALEVIKSRAQQLNSPLIIVTREMIDSLLPKDLSLPLIGQHQRMNAALALATVHCLNSLINVKDSAVRDGLSNVAWPGRFQIISRGGNTYIVDGAHNPAAAKTLAATVRDYFGNKELDLFFGILRDKDWQQVISILAPLARRIFLVPVHSDRTADPGVILPVANVANPQAIVQVCNSLSDALRMAGKNRNILIAGSLFLAGEALELLDSEDMLGNKNERWLNELAENKYYEKQK